MTAEPFAKITEFIAEIDRLARAGDWDAATALSSQFQAANFISPSNADVDALRSALDSVANIRERAEWLRSDLDRLLSAFEPPKS